MYTNYRESASKPGPVRASLPVTKALAVSSAGVLFLGVSPAPINALFAGIL